MPIGAILLIAAATVYAKRQGVPVGDAALQALKNPWGCMVLCSSTADHVDDSEDSLPTNYGDDLQQQRSSSSSNSNSGIRPFS